MVVLQGRARVASRKKGQHSFGGGYWRGVLEGGGYDLAGTILQKAGGLLKERKKAATRDQFNCRHCHQAMHIKEGGKLYKLLPTSCQSP